MYYHKFDLNRCKDLLQNFCGCTWVDPYQDHQYQVSTPIFHGIIGAFLQYFANF